MATPTREQRDQRERIKADIATLKQQLERTDLTAAQRIEIRDEIREFGLSLVIAESDDD